MTPRRTSVAAGVLLACLLLTGGRAQPVRAADTTGLTLTVAPRWNSQGGAGTWSPYVITVRNDGPGTFVGDVTLVPDTTYRGPFAPNTFPPYRGQVRVPHGSQTSVLIYAVVPQGSYHAELHDASGTLVLQADPAVTPGGTAVAVLSDLPTAGQRITAPLTTLTQLNVAISQFPSAQSFPAGAAYLSGLSGLVIDEFDTGKLSSGQLLAIRDFVALGGTLIEVAGPSWRRELLPLPAELQAFQPASPQTASLSAISALAGLTTSATVQVETGTPASWAATTLAAAPGGPPLVVEGVYGSGRVVTLTFDPLAPPFDADVTLSALAWSQAISRGLDGVQGPAGILKLTMGLGNSGMAGSGPGIGAGSVYPGSMDQAFNEVPGGANPPYGLLILLMVCYVLLVTFLSYAVLRRFGRGGLLWVTVPAIALAVTAGAYGIGFGTRGQDYQLVQVQVQRLGPGGVVETDSFEGLLSPRRGDFTVSAPAGSLVTTFIPFYSGTAPNGGQNVVVTAGAEPRVLFSNVPVWDMRPLQTMSVTHPLGSATGAGMPIEASLRFSHGRIQGTVVNRTSHALRDLRLIGLGGLEARVAVAVAPGATATVDAPVTAGTVGTTGKGVVFGPQPPSGNREALLQMAASQVTGQAGDLALVGLTDATDTVTVGGQRPARSARAAVVEPVSLLASDSASNVVPLARMISSFSTKDGNQLDIYELTTPPGLTSHVGLVVGPQLGQGTTPAVEVYDWTRDTWRTVPTGANPGVASPTTVLSDGERQGGVIRVRVHESAPRQTSITLADTP